MFSVRGCGPAVSMNATVELGQSDSYAYCPLVMSLRSSTTRKLSFRRSISSSFSKKMNTLAFSINDNDHNNKYVY